MKPEIKNKYVYPLIFLSFLALIFLVYSNSLNNKFFGDDWKLIVENQYITSWSYFPKLFTRAYFFYFGDLSSRWVTSLSYIMDYSLWKLNPAGWRVSTLFTHFICAALIFLIMNKALKNRTVAFFIAALFAVHPIHTEEVNEVSLREDIQVFALMLVSFYLYLKNSDFSDKALKALFLAGSLGAYALALFTKETAVMLPFIILLYNYSFNKKPYIDYKMLILTLLVIGYFICTTYYLYSPVVASGDVGRQSVYPGGSLFSAVMTTVEATVFYYFSKFIYTGAAVSGLGYPETNYGIRLLLALVIVAGSLCAGLFYRKRRPEIFFGVFFFYVNLFPVSNIIPIGLTAAERYAYIPSLGFFIVLSAVLYSVIKGKRFLMWSLFFALILYYSFNTVRRNVEFRDTEKIYKMTVENYPESFESYSWLGFYYLNTGNYTSAISYYNKAVEKLTKTLKNLKYYNSNYYDQYYAYRFWIGYAYWQQGAEEAAKRYFNEFIETAPLRMKNKNYYPYFYLGDYYFRRGDLAGSRRYFLEGLKYNPYCAPSFQNIGLIDLLSDNASGALENFQKAIQINPKTFQAFNNLGAVYILQRDYFSAEKALERALEVEPGHPDVYYNLAIVKRNLGKAAEAENMARKYFELRNEPLKGDINKIIDELFNSPKGIFASIKPKV